MNAGQLPAGVDAGDMYWEETGDVGVKLRRGIFKDLEEVEGRAWVRIVGESNKVWV